MYRRVRMELSGSPSTEEEQSQLRAMKSWTEFFGKEYSPIVSNFNGQCQIKIVCTKCNNVSERYEPWLMLKAPIPGAEVEGGRAPTLTECLDSAFETETIDDYACEKCKEKTQAKKSERISRLPPVTIVSIKRFTNAGHKVRGRIPWNLDALDFAPWYAFTRDPFKNSAAESEYVTYAVIEHHGSTHGGHYRMYARHHDDTWYEYDDSSVRTVPPENVITPDSYIALMMPKARMGAMCKDMDSAIEQFRKLGVAEEA
jgi:ubiquitin C-terminal hydrolase